MMTAFSADRFLEPMQQRLDQIISNPSMANLICRLLPDRCPFERRIYLFGRLICHIPPLCKLNPCYGFLMELRSRAIAYLDEVEEQ